MSARPIFYDTETTGVKSDRDRVIELAAYDPLENRTFEQLINPSVPIPAETSAIHGITDEMVAGAPTFAAVAEQFMEFCSGEVVLVAHNNDTFDQLFMQQEFARAGVGWPTTWRFLDSLKWSRRYRSDLPRHSLQFLREVYRIPANNAHRALDDVVVLHKVFSAMLDDLTIDEALELMYQKRLLRVMPFGKHQGTPLEEIPKNYIAWLKEQGALDKDDNALLKESLAAIGAL